MDRSGFVEPGESLDACDGREIVEEAGISIRYIHCSGSQPWPFRIP